MGLGSQFSVLSWDFTPRRDLIEHTDYTLIIYKVQINSEREITAWPLDMHL